MPVTRDGPGPAVVAGMYNGPGGGLVLRICTARDRLANAIDEEFGGISMACCLGLRPSVLEQSEANPGAASLAAGDRRRSDARSRMEQVRSCTDSQLEQQEQAELSAGANSGGPRGQQREQYANPVPKAGNGVITVMIAGLSHAVDSAAGGTIPARANASEVDHIFHVLGVAGAQGSLTRTHSNSRALQNHPGRLRGAASMRALPPILISPSLGPVQMRTGMPSPGPLWNEPITPPSESAANLNVERGCTWDAGVAVADSGIPLSFSQRSAGLQYHGKA